MDLVPALLSDDQNIALIVTSSDEEVNEAIFSINHDSSPGLDGLTAYFYQNL